MGWSGFPTNFPAIFSRHGRAGPNLFVPVSQQR